MSMKREFFLDMSHREFCFVAMSCVVWWIIFQFAGSGGIIFFVHLRSDQRMYCWLRVLSHSLLAVLELSHKLRKKTLLLRS